MDLNGWSERRPRAWRRGRVLPIWQGSNCTRPLHRWHISKSIKFGMQSSCETIVFPNGTVVLVDGVYVALGLGVADVCCRFGKVPVAFVPSIGIWSLKLCFAPSTQNGFDGFNI